MDIGDLQVLRSSSFEHWLSALERRHLADLRLPELTRALRALSSAYVERRQTIARGAALNSAGKRAAFALFYAPLHFLAIRHVLIELGADTPRGTLLDLGSGTGAAGAAWATQQPNNLASQQPSNSATHQPSHSATQQPSHSATQQPSHLEGPRVIGIDLHPWAVAETRWTYRHFELHGQSRRGDVSRLPTLHARDSIVAAYVLNELNDRHRLQVQEALLAAATQGVRVLVVEPIARTLSPWWEGFGRQAHGIGGRIDEWRIPVDLPPLLQRLDAAAGLNHRILKLRSVYFT